MKKLIFILLFSINAYANNSYQILLSSSKNSLQVIENLSKNINKNEDWKGSFDNLVATWKSVQTHYILGNFDEDLIDIPRYIDIFNIGNENIYQQLDLIIKSDDNLNIALYKNSHKTINALEYVLSKKDLKNPRIKNIAIIILQNLKIRLSAIHNGYKKYQNTTNKDNLNAWLVNSLIDSTYFLKEWRIGNPNGLSRKYAGKVNPKLAEYHFSNNSFIAISAILESQLAIINNIDNKEIKDYKNQAEDIIVKMLIISQNINKFDTKNSKQLYTLATKLLRLYYDGIIKKLNITAKILDADGD